MKNKNNYITKNKYVIFGIIGAICFGIGDWLLGYVDTASTADVAFEFIRSGHGTSYDTSKVIIAMVLATIGFFFYYPGLVHMADIVKKEKDKRRLQYLLGTSSFVLIVIHTYYCVNVFVYAWLMQNGGENLAAKLSLALGNAMLPSVALGYIPLALPLVMHFIFVIKEKTVLKKSAIIFHPAVWMIMFNIFANVLPESPFSYGLYTFAMNAGMLVWYIYELIFTEVWYEN